MNHSFNRHSPYGLFGARNYTASMKPRWKNLGSCEIEGSVCEWTIQLAIRPELQRPLGLVAGLLQSRCAQTLGLAIDKETSQLRNVATSVGEVDSRCEATHRGR